MSESEFDAVFRELVRIFGDTPMMPPGEKHFTILPLVGEDDAVEFFRSVPAGTQFEELSKLASEYRAAHPAPSSDRDGEDPDAAG